MKKAISLSFLLLANMIILVHAVIPHHHHNQIPIALFAVYHEQDNRAHEYHHHNDTGPVRQSANTQGHEITEDCLLNKSYIKVGSDKQAFQSPDPDSSLLPCLPLLFQDNSTLKITDYGGLPFRQKPYLRSYHAELISHSLGLRAPPVC